MAEMVTSVSASMAVPAPTLTSVVAFENDQPKISEKSSNPTSVKAFVMGSSSSVVVLEVSAEAVTSTILPLSVAPSSSIFASALSVSKSSGSKGVYGLSSTVEIAWR